jgi:transcriptional repressor of cell division inhibition gene dicB
MRANDVIEYFGSINKVAAVLNISRQAIQSWRKDGRSLVPMGRAYQLENLTEGKLKVKPKLYENGRK